ncbi:MAG TPA: YcnI family protein [Burkholderiaceae bacterium]
MKQRSTWLANTVANTVANAVANAAANAAAIAVTIGMATAAPWASAHITLEQKQAPAGSYYKAVLQVPHGCKGSATTAVRVRIPDGIFNAKPQPKPGWTLKITRSKLAQPVDAGHGHVLAERVSEIAWTGGPLPDDNFDEFRIVMKLPDRPGTTLYLPVVQECVKGSTRWIEQPDAARPGVEPEFPAPALQLGAKP